MNENCQSNEHADQSIRSLERTLAADPTSATEFDLVKERFRSGLVTWDRLKIAAHCGDKFARALAQQQELHNVTFEHWVEVFNLSEKSIALRVWIIIAARRIHEFPQGEGRNLLIHALQECIEFALCPCVSNVANVERAYLLVREVHYSPLLGADTPRRSAAAASVVYLASDIGTPDDNPFNSVWLPIVAANTERDLTLAELKSLKGDISKWMSRWLLFETEFLRDLNIPELPGITSTRPPRPKRKPVGKKSKKK